jgi:ABC-2 type transport system ATP-binding protein
VLQGNVAKIRSNFNTRSYLVRSDNPISSTDFEILSQVENNGTVETKIQKLNVGSNNSLLNSLIKQTEIHTFEELLPSMNDIFIETVRK